jgi:ABC-2 type transport system ATP-binding protein
MIELRNIQKSYGTQQVLAGVDLTLEKGKTAMLFGENGSGKTTLLRILSGTLSMDQGTLSFENEFVDTRSIEWKSRLGFMPTSMPQMNGFNARDFIHWINSIRKTTLDTHIIEAFSIDAFFRVDIQRLSSGQKKKLLLYSAIAHRPQLLVLDEPEANLDPESKKNFRKLITQIKKQAYILEASHSSRGDVNYLLDQGKIQRH